MPLGGRCCSVCGCADHLTANEAEQDQFGNTLYEHHVGFELRYLKAQAECIPQLKARGWRYRITQGQHSMERDICKGCLIATQDMSQEFRRKKEKELGAKNFDPYYLAVCGE